MLIDNFNAGIWIYWDTGAGYSSSCVSTHKTGERVIGMNIPGTKHLCESTCYMMNSG